MTYNNSQLNKNRPADSEFPMLMTKQTLGDYLGKSESVVNQLLRNTCLNEVVFQIKGSDPMYIKPLVDEALRKLR